MTKKFALAGLLRVRELQEERAAAELANANRLRAQAEQNRAQAREALSNIAFPDLAFADAAAYGENHHMPASHELSWRAVVAARAASTALLGEMTQMARQAQIDADGAAVEWTQAKMRAAMIEKLQAKHEAALIAEDLRSEQLVLDEAALRRTKEASL